MTKKKTETKTEGTKPDTKPDFTVPDLKQGKRVQLTVSIDEKTDEALDKIFFNGQGLYRNRSDVLRTAIQHFIDSQ